MKVHVSTSLGVVLQEADKDKTTKQNLTNVVADPTEDKVLEVQEIFATLAPEDVTVVGMTETVQSAYY